MGHFICHHKDRFFMWSSVVDAPITFGLSRNEFTSWYRAEYGKGDARIQDDLPTRMTRAIDKGTSAFMYGSLEHLVRHNHAGYGGSRLTLEQIIQIYCVERREPREGEGEPIRYDNEGSS